MERVYICIDLKSFYASCECVERGLDPLKTNLVVADRERTEKTVCLAVTPSLKKYGIGGRARLYEVVSRVKEINKERRVNNNYKVFTGKSFDSDELKSNDLELDFIIARPRMKLYMDYSNKIYNIYLKYVSKDDIYVYSIDEVFMDVTNYLNTYKISAEALTTIIMQNIYEETHITATGGVGSNMYLAKVAMDIVAKHVDANEYGVRVASLDPISYRKKLWNHLPLTDFWRVGVGIANKLNMHGIYTMGDIARTSIDNEDLLFKLFGINAEFLIDHAWGVEYATMRDIKSFKPSHNSLGCGQVLHCPYTYDKCKIIVKEMVDSLILDMVKKDLVTKKLVLYIGYDIENTKNYNGPLKKDHYGRYAPQPVRGVVNLDDYTSSTKVIMDEVIKVYEKITNHNLTIRRVNISAVSVIRKASLTKSGATKQLSIFDEVDNNSTNTNKDEIDEKENKLQHVLLDIKEKYGKNSILRGMNLEDGGTMIERNEQVGGHRA